MPGDLPPARRAGAGLATAHTAILLALGAGVIAAALLAHYRLAGRSAEKPPAGQGANSPGRTVWQWPTPTTAPALPTSPAEMASRPFAGTELAPLEKLPADLIAPPGAVRSYAFRRRLPDGVIDNVVYVSEADIAEVEAFYRTALGRAGYKLVRPGPTSRPAEVRLLFLRGGKESYLVSLGLTDKGKKVRISIVVTRAAP